MLQRTSNPRVKLVGGHPWAGCTGTAISLDDVGLEGLPFGVQIKVRLDEAPNVPDGHECYAGRDQVALLNW